MNVTHAFVCFAYNVPLLVDIDQCNVNPEALRMRAFRQKVKETDPVKYEGVKKKAIER